MNIEKHGNKYRVNYRCSNYDKVIHESFDSKEEAELRLSEIRLKKKQGVLLPPAHLVDPDANHALACETMTVEQLMREYVTLYGVNHWSAGTLSGNLHRIHDYIIPYIGEIPIKSLTTHRLETYYRKLLTKPAVMTKGKEHRQTTISPSVIEKIHAIIRSALNQAIRWDYLKGTNPAMAVELPKYRRVEREAWTEEEVVYALSVCTDPVLKLCILLAVGCSMRIGEILGLTWDCVHIEPELVANDESCVFVEKELQRCDITSLTQLQEQGRNDVFFTFPQWKQTNCTTLLVLKTPKTQSSIRTIYVAKHIADELRQVKEHQTAVKSELGEYYTDFNLVVAQDNGRPFEEHLIAQRLRKLIAENDLRPVVFHSLRHSSTSIKLKISGNIKAVQGDTGHAQSRMVTDVYSHVVDSDRKHLARSFDEHFFSDENKKAATTEPNMEKSTQELLELLQKSPELAGTLLQLTKTLRGNG